MFAARSFFRFSDPLATLFTKSRRLYWLPFLLAVTLLMAAGFGQTYSYYTIGFPGAVGTSATGVNKQGQIVGWYASTAGPVYGFLLTNGQYIKISFNGAGQTRPWGINDLGQVSGQYIDSAGNGYGFLLDNVQCLQIGASQQHPCTVHHSGPYAAVGNAYTEFSKINNAGIVVGAYILTNTDVGGFSFANGNFTYYTCSQGGSPFLYGINNLNQVVGGATLGTIGSEDCSLIQDPNGVQTDAAGINDQGLIVGTYRTLTAVEFIGFLSDGVDFWDIAPPQSTLTFANGINNEGQIVGEYEAGTGFAHGFVAQLPCGNQRDQLLAEYPTYLISFFPTCGQMTESAGSVYFQFSDINHPCRSQKAPEYGYAVISESLVAPASSGYGLDAWRVAYGGPRTISSGYRDPKQNSGCGGARNSPHLFGQASDFANESYSTNCGSGTACLKEYNAMVLTARKAHADYIEPPQGPCGYKCTHADWRDHETPYAQ